MIVAKYPENRLEIAPKMKANADSPARIGADRDHANNANIIRQKKGKNETRMLNSPRIKVVTPAEIPVLISIN
jgi:hypothetical protein